MNIGEYIKSVRKSRGFTREDLTDICSVKTLYRTENGLTTPSQTLLDKLSKKFGVDFITYYTRISEIPSEISEEDKEKIIELDRNWEHEKLLYFTTKLLDKYEFSSENDRQFISYYYIRSRYFHNDEVDFCLEYIREKFNYNEDTFDLKIIETHFTTIEVKVLLLTAFILINSGRTESCYNLLSTFDIRNIDISKHSLSKSSDFLKLTFNKALVMFRLEMYEQVREDIEYTLVICERHYLFDRLNRFYWLYAKYFFVINDIDSCHEYCYRYLKTCEVMGHDTMITLYTKKFKEDFGFEYKTYANR